MARNGQTDVTWNEGYFSTVLRSPGIKAVTDAAIGRVLMATKASAPVDTGAYEDSLHIEHHESKYRESARVVASDPKALLIEAKRGTLAKGLKAAKG